MFDTTGIGYFEAKSKKHPPEIADLNLWLQKKVRGAKVRVRSLKEVDVEKPAIVYEAQISGLG